MSEYTYENPVLIENPNGLGCKGCGGSHPFFTVNCRPVVIPDQWQQDSWVDNQVPLAATGVLESEVSYLGE